MFARRTYSSNAISRAAEAKRSSALTGTQATSSGSGSGSSVPLNPASLSDTLLSRPVPIPNAGPRRPAAATRCLCYICKPRTFPDCSYELLPSSPLSPREPPTILDPKEVTDLAPPQVSEITVRRSPSPKATSAECVQGPIVYGNGHWVLWPKAANESGEGTAAQRSLKAHVSGQRDGAPVEGHEGAGEAAKPAHRSRERLHAEMARLLAQQADENDVGKWRSFEYEMRCEYCALEQTVECRRERCGM